MKKSIESIMVALVVLVGACKDHDNVPSECEGIETIYKSEACLTALMDRCRAITTEADCWAAEPVEVDTVVHCAWTDVAVVEDAQTCEFGATFGRCEAAIVNEWADGAFVNPCVNGAFVEPGHTAFVHDMELVDVADSPDGRLYDAPMGPWAVIGSEAASTIATCGFGGAEPQWCSCGPAACLVGD